MHNETPSKTSERRTIIVAAICVVAVGLLIAGGMLLILNSGDSTAACSGPQPIGLASGLQKQAELSPFNGTLGGRCEYWVIYRDGKLQASKSRIAGRDCSLEWYTPINGFRCDREPVAWGELIYWPSRIIAAGEFEGTFEVDFGTSTSG